MRPRGLPRPGNAPGDMVTAIGIAVAVLLLCTGTLLGATWTSRFLRSRVYQQASAQAEERRVLAEEWQTLRQQRNRCPHCTSPLPGPDSYSAPAVMQD